MYGINVVYNQRNNVVKRTNLQIKFILSAFYQYSMPVAHWYAFQDLNYSNRLPGEKQDDRHI